MQREQLALLPAVWRSIYGDDGGYIGLFSGVRQAPGSALSRPHQAYVTYPAAISRAQQWIEQESRAGRELYHCAHLLSQPRRRREHAAPLAALYVDLDNELPAQMVLTPSLMVASSPGRYQLYFRLTHPVDPEQGAALNRRLSAALRADPSGWDLTQLLRVPGTRNLKYPDEPLVRLDAERPVSYDPRELEAFLPQMPVAPYHRPDDPGDAQNRPKLARQAPASRLISSRAETGHAGAAPEPPIPLTQPARAIWEGRDVKLTPDGRVDRSASLVRISRMLVQAGLPRQHIVATLAERDVSLGWRKFSDRSDATERYDQLVDLVLRETPTQRGRR